MKEYNRILDEQEEQRAQELAARMESRVAQRNRSRLRHGRLAMPGCRGKGGGG